MWLDAVTSCQLLAQEQSARRKEEITHWEEGRVVVNSTKEVVNRVHRRGNLILAGQAITVKNNFDQEKSQTVISLCVAIRRAACQRGVQRPPLTAVVEDGWSIQERDKEKILCAVCGLGFSMNHAQGPRIFCNSVPKMFQWVEESGLLNR